MAANESTVNINIATILRGLDKVKALRDELERLAKIKVGGGVSSAGADRAAALAQKLAVQTKELEVRMEAARQRAERLSAAKERLANISRRTAAATGGEADSHVKVFRAIEKQRLVLGSAADAHVRYFKATEQVGKSANSNYDSHVKFFKSVQRASPVLDAHVQAYRAIEKAQKDSAKSTNTLDQTLGRIGGSLRNLGLGLTSLGSALSIGLTAPLATVGVVSLRSAVSMDSLRLGLKAVTGSSAEAEVQLARLTEIAKLPGIGFQEAIQGSVRLQALGVSAETSERALKAFANAVALTGGNRENLDRALIQLTQLISKGKVLQQDLRFIIENAPATGKALRDAFGTVNPEEIEALGLTTDQFLDRLFTGLEGLPRAAAGARNTLDNFADAVFRVSASVGEAVIPVLTRFIEIIEPIAIRLAELFRSLPEPVQTLVVVFGGLAASLGPLLFIVGQFSTGVGGLISSFGRLHALGITPTIAGFKTLTAVMLGAQTAALNGARAAAAATAGWAALGASLFGITAIVGVALVALGAFSKGQKESNQITEEQVKSASERIAALQREQSFLGGLRQGVARTSKEQDTLRQIYERLNAEARARVQGAKDESDELRILREELQRIINLRQEEQRQAAGVLAANLEENIRQSNELSAAVEARTERVRQLLPVLEQLRAGEQALTREQVKRAGIVLPLESEENRAAQLRALETEIFRLTAANDKARVSIGEFDAKAREQLNTLDALKGATGETEREMLALAFTMGRLPVSVGLAERAIEDFRREGEDAAKSADELTSALDRQADSFRRVGQEADNARRKRQDELQGVRAFIREHATSVEQAEQLLEGFLALDSFRDRPVLKGLIDKERLANDIEEGLAPLLGGKAPRGRAGTDIRNAQEQLARALADVAESSAERLATIERAKNDRLLQENEFAFRLQLTSYRQYLNERARLTALNLQIEIDAQKQKQKEALDEEIRLRGRAARRDIPQAERTRAEAKAEEARKRQIDAANEITRLEEEQGSARREAAQALAEAARQQDRDIRQLTIDYGELTGRIQDSLDAATDERFRETLQALSLAQADLNQKLVRARALKDADAEKDAQDAIRRNQAQIDLINNTIRLERAVNALSASEEFATRAKERQSQLEKQIAFDVEFRGQSEEEAIARRLKGEEDLKKALLIQRDILQSEIDLLEQLGLTAPKALRDKVEEINVEIQPLGKLSFSEQFRLAEKEFSRLQDELANKIADVERAVRSRDIAEVEGRLIARRLNGEYAGDLERQLAILKEIAAQSGDVSLRRQAEAAAQQTKDVRAAADEVANLDKQLRAVSIDSFNDSLSQLFKDLRDNTESALQDILNFFNRILDRVNDFIAENLAREITESLFPDPNAPQKEGGIVGFFKRIIGLGGDTPSTDANTTATEENTAALNSLTTAFGGQAPATSPVESLKTDPLGTIKKIGGFFGGLFGGGEEEEGGEKGGIGGFLGELLGLSPVDVEGAPDGATVIDSLNINSDELRRNTEALRRNTEARGGGAERAGGLAELFSSAFDAGEFSFASGGRVPLRVSHKERYIPPPTVKRYGKPFFDRLNAGRLTLKDRMVEIRGPGTTTSDSIRAFAPPGSYIVNASAAEHEARLLDSISEGRMNVGGMVASVDNSVMAGRVGSSERPQVNIRSNNFVTPSGIVKPYMDSQPGTVDLLNWIGEQREEIGRRLGIN